MTSHPRAGVSFRSLAAIGLLACLAFCSTQPSTAMSFTSGPSPTLSEEIELLDVAVIVRRVTPAGEGKQEDSDWFEIDYVVETIVKGEQHVRVGQQINVLTYRDGKADDLFLLMAEKQPKMMWSTPVPLSPRGREYVLQLRSLARQGPERLKFFYAYLGDRDEILELDAHQEFAAADYATLQQLRAIFKPEQLVKWVQDREVPASRRRVYYQLLSICGGERELPVLEKILRSENRLERAALEAAIECYLTLKGADGLSLVDELFLRDKQAHYIDVYCAIMAMRLHASERKVIPRERLLASLRLVLKRYDIADLVIPDLIKWEDWSVVDDVFTAFKAADEESRWLRVPAIQYLRRCPLAKAKAHLRACERIDPHSVRGANEQIKRERKP